MSTLRTNTIRLAASMPEGSNERNLLLAALKTAGFSIGDIEDGGQMTFTPAGKAVYVHVWFDKVHARTDFGTRADSAGEWQVIVSTSSDPLNLKPRGRELERKTFRYVEERVKNQVQAAAMDYIKDALFQYRNGVK